MKTSILFLAFLICCWSVAAMGYRMLGANDQRNGQVLSASALINPQTSWQFENRKKKKPLQNGCVSRYSVVCGCKSLCMVPRVGENDNAKSLAIVVDEQRRRQIWIKCAVFRDSGKSSKRWLASICAQIFASNALLVQ
jgi:hypothetical protein